MRSGIGLLVVDASVFATILNGDGSGFLFVCTCVLLRIAEVTDLRVSVLHA
jgi:hypothetical protein